MTGESLLKTVGAFLLIFVNLWQFCVCLCVCDGFTQGGLPLWSCEVDSKMAPSSRDLQLSSVQ